MKICEHIPITIMHSASDAMVEEEHLVAERFAGVLLHPVPWSEMLYTFEVNSPGQKVIVEWPHQARLTPDIKAGDILRLADATYSIAGVRSFPHCYIEVFVAA